MKARFFEDFRAGDNATLEKAKNKAREFVAEVLAAPYGRAGWALTLCGPAGTGKTMLAECILCALGLDAWGICSAVKPMLIGGRKAELTGLLVDWRQAGREFRAKDYGSVDEMKEAGVLVLDDVGADDDPFKSSVAVLDEVLRARAGRWTVVTTNLTGNALKEKIDARVFSWLNRGGNTVVEIAAKDFCANLSLQRIQ